VEILRNLLGNLGSGVIRLLVAVGILAAAYFFVLRPVLDTGKKITHEFNKGIETNVERSFKGYGRNGAGIEDVSKTLRKVDREVREEIKRSFHVAKSHGVLNPKKLVRCIQRAEGNAHKIQRCTVKF
jgi:hypothetical protein